MEIFYSSIEDFQENELGKKDVTEQITLDSEQPDAQPVLASVPDLLKLSWRGYL